jgi:hypothetical protein
MHFLKNRAAAAVVCVCGGSVCGGVLEVRSFLPVIVVLSGQDNNWRKCVGVVAPHQLSLFLTHLHLFTSIFAVTVSVLQQQRHKSVRYIS